MVAVKILRSDLFGGAQAEARFLREAEAVAAVRSRSIVGIHDRGRTEDGLMYLVMELVDGVPLDDVLDDAVKRAKELGSPEQVRDTGWLRELLGTSARIEPTWVRQCVTWGLQLAEGLASCHESGIYHRDVKPSNVVIRRDGSAVLIDFGIAALDAEATLAAGDGLVGTPAYMAPERLTRPATDSADVYGLTATLYYAVTLTPPYRGTSTEVLSELRRRDPPPARDVRSDLSRDMQAILDAGMARDVTHRYPSVVALAGDLRAFLENRPLVARPITIFQRWWRRAKRSREVRGVLALAVVALSGLAAHSIWEGRRARRASEWLGVWAGVPPTLCVAPSSIRAIRDPEAEAREAARLDRLVELASGPLPSRVVRAAFRLDHGDRSGAAEDFAVIADELGTPIARELARRYAESQISVVDIPTHDLPQPRTAEDRYLVAFHLIRNAKRHEGAFAQAQSLLDEQTTTSLHFAAEMRLLHDAEIASSNRVRSEKLAALRTVRIAAIRLEERLGRPLASTLMVNGVALFAMERFSDAVTPLQAAVELAPSDHSLRINLAHCLQETRREKAAREHLEYAIQLRPSSVGARKYLVNILILLDEFDAADAAVREIPPGGVDAETRRRMFGTVHYEHAFHRHLELDEEGARALARTAIDNFVDKHGVVLPDYADEVLVCRAILDGNADGIFAALVRELASDPTSWRDIDVVKNLMPSDLSPAHTAALREYLEALIRHLAPTGSPPSPEPPNSQHLDRDR